MSPVPMRAESSTLEPRSKPKTAAAPAAAKNFGTVAGASVSEPRAVRRPSRAAAQARMLTREARKRSTHASTVAASSEKEALPPGSGRSLLQAWSTPNAMAGDQRASRSMVAMA